MSWQQEARDEWGRKIPKRSAIDVVAREAYGKDDNQRVGGMPLKAIKGMLKSPNTPEQIKNAWKAKLKLKGIVV